MRCTQLLLCLVFVLAILSCTRGACEFRTCQKNLGGACNDTIDCAENMFCNVTSNSCANLIPVGGTRCTGNFQCVGGDIQNSVCSNFTCVSVTYNALLGQNCSFINNCKTEFSCTSGVCVSYVPSGDNCTIGPNTVPCATGSVCNLGQCVEIGSVAEGDQCRVQGSGFSTICAPGLYCQSGNAVGQHSVCAPGFTSSNTPCNQTTGCSNPNENCGCNTNGAQVCTAPIVATAAQISQVKQLDSCVVEKNCNALDPTCCEEYQCVSYTLLYHNYPFPCGNPYNCADQGHKGMSKTEKIILIAAAVVVAVIVVTVIAVFVRRGRQSAGYHPVN